MLNPNPSPSSRWPPKPPPSNPDFFHHVGVLGAAATRVVVAGRWQVLVDGFAVGDEAVAQLEAASQTAVGCQCQDQERHQEGEAGHQQSNRCGVMQVRCAVMRLGVQKLQRECTMRVLERIPVWHALMSHTKAH